MAIRQVTSPQGQGIIPRELRDLMSLAVFMRQMTGSTDRTALSLGSNFLSLAGRVSSKDSLDYQQSVLDLLDSNRSSILEETPGVEHTYDLTQSHVQDVLDQSKAVHQVQSEFNKSLDDLTEWRETNQFDKSSGDGIQGLIDSIMKVRRDAVTRLSREQYGELSEHIIGLNVMAQAEEFLKKSDRDLDEQGIQLDDKQYGREKIQQILDMFKNPIYRPVDIAKEMEGISGRQFASVESINKDIQDGFELVNRQEPLKMSEVDLLRKNLNAGLRAISSNQILTDDMKKGLVENIDQIFDGLSVFDRDNSYGNATDALSFSRSISKALLLSDGDTGQNQYSLDIPTGNRFDGELHTLENPEEVMNTINYALRNLSDSKDILQSRMIEGTDYEGEYAHIFRDIQDQEAELQGLATIYSTGIGEDNPNRWMHDLYKDKVPASVIQAMYVQRVGQGIDDPYEMIRFGKKQMILSHNYDFKTINNLSKHLVWSKELQEAVKDYDIPFQGAFAPSAFNISDTAIDATTSDMLLSAKETLDNGIVALAFADDGGAVHKMVENYNVNLRGEKVKGQTKSPLAAKAELVESIKKMFFDEKTGEWTGNPKGFKVDHQLLWLDPQHVKIGTDIGLLQKMFQVRDDLINSMEAFPAMTKIAGQSDPYKTVVLPKLTPEEEQAYADSIALAAENQNADLFTKIELTEEQEELLANYRKVIPINISLEGRVDERSYTRGKGGKPERDAHTIVTGSPIGPVGKHKLGPVTEKIEKILGGISRGETMRELNKAYSIEDLPQSEEAFDEFVIEILETMKPSVAKRMISGNRTDSPGFSGLFIEEYLNALKTHIYSPI